MSELSSRLNKAIAMLNLIQEDLKAQDQGLPNEIRPDLEGYWPRLEPGRYRIALGNATQYTLRLYDNGPCLEASIIGGRCYEFPFGKPVEPNYLYEKMGLSTVDSHNFADFLNCQLGVRAGSPTHGKYYREFTYLEQHDPGLALDHTPQSEGQSPDDSDLPPPSPS